MDNVIDWMMPKNIGYLRGEGVRAWPSARLMALQRWASKESCWMGEGANAALLLASKPEQQEVLDMAMAATSS